jgi:6-phosphogluconolactonase
MRPGDPRNSGIGRTASAILSVGALVVLASCGSSGSGCLFCTTTVNREFLYVANSGSNNVSAYSVNANSAALTPVPGSPFATRTNPSSMTLVSGVTSMAQLPYNSTQFAYVVDSGSDSVSAYSIDTVTGVLTELPGSPFAAGSNPISMSILTPGPPVMAYVVNHDSNNVSGYIVDLVKGTLAPVAGSPFATGSGPVSVSSCLLRNAYVVNNGSNDVSAYVVDSGTGVLTTVSGSPFATGAGPVSFTFDAFCKFAYIANFADGTISAYSVDATTGVLTPIAGSPFPAGSGPASVTVVSAGVGMQFALVLNQGSNNISAYAIDASAGALSAVAGSPFAVGSSPSRLIVDGTGRFVYVTNASSNNISAFAFGSTGTLTPLGGSPYAVGTRPVDLTVLIPSTQSTTYLAYAANGGSNDVSGFTIDGIGGRPTSGTMTAVAGSPFAAGVSPAAVTAIKTSQTSHQ